VDQVQIYVAPNDRQRMVAIILAKQALRQIYKTGYVNKKAMNAVVRAIEELDKTGVQLRDLD
jgi:hypothetical protein